ncbi:hypothetical protein [Lysinibacillus sphaericus]|uniref:hypothetical protein n=1 Tax=Lysinibacillus sphaericus TaxID=1421 RepID=UPI003D72B4B7
MNVKEKETLEFKKDDFALNFEITADAMGASGDLETWTTIFKVTKASTCTCVCTVGCF